MKVSKCHKVEAKEAPEDQPFDFYCTKCGEPCDVVEGEEIEIEFDCCSDCDLPEVCSDYGCAIKQGIKSPILP
jgi:hypothetical protein